MKQYNQQMGRILKAQERAQRQQMQQFNEYQRRQQRQQTLAQEQQMMAQQQQLSQGGNPKVNSMDATYRQQYRDYLKKYHQYF